MKSSVFLAIMVCGHVLTGCNGGGASCPWERPSCCDNNLFGCGPFDIPQGCSCGDYLSRSFQGSPIRSKAVSSRQTLTTSEGTWRISLTQNGEGCSYLKRQTTATALIRERNQQVSVKLLGLATLRGNRVGRNVRTRGRMKVPFSQCAATVKSEMNLSSAKAGSITGTVDVTCSEQALSCSTTYSGALKRL